ncbi:MAG: protein kinase [Myxococcales bacterium]|jgi:serine/threonine-protein kinase|nr:protein kinase [Myxococcales bacterium]
MLERYEIREEIGRGGMAVVYRAYDTHLQREVAIKLLHSHLISHGEARARFEREAHSVARLMHPSIVGVHDYCETADGEVFLVMELVSGFTLRQFLDQRGLDESHTVMAEVALLIAKDILSALAVAHDEGIIHRDVKPENILISENGEVRLSDFGIAYLADIGQMTVTGQILGSPMYMSPEHIEHAVLDARADIFSVGIMMYEMAVGVLPFSGTNPHQVIKRIVEGYYDHPLSLNPAVGHRIASIIVRCLQAQPERRFATAADVITEIDAALAEMKMPPSSRTLLAAFFQDPDAAEADLLRQIIPQTLSLGKTALRTRRLPEAMNHFNRVLALDPGNTAALDAVNMLSRQRRLRRNLERVAVFLAMGITVTVLVVLLVMGWLPGPGSHAKGAHPEGETADNLSAPYAPIAPPSVLPGLSRDAAAATTTPPPETPAPSQDTSTMPQTPSADASAAATTPRGQLVRPGRKHVASTVEAETRVVVFNPSPMSVDIAIEGGETFTYKTTDRSRTLSVGMHKITFTPRDERLQPLTMAVDVKSGDEPLSIGARLRWKPGTLRVRSNAEASVSIDGVMGGKTNAPLSISFGATPERQAQLLITADGYRPISRTVQLQAAQATEVVVHLEKAGD